MAKIIVTDKDFNESNLQYIQSSLSEILGTTSSAVQILRRGSRSILSITCDDGYENIMQKEVADKVAEILAISYKYDFFKKNVKISGLNDKEYEILLTSLIAADLEEDKRFSFEKIVGSSEVVIDGIYNFRLQQLKKKWEEIVSFIPPCFVNSQLKDFISYLLENKKRRIFIEGEKVFDCHFRRLLRVSLLGGEKVKIVREALLSNCGEIELSGEIPEEDEYYLKEFYNDKIVFHTGYFN